MKVGDYELELPDFWQERGQVHSKPQFHRWNAVARPGVNFDFFVFEKRGHDLEQWARIVAAQVEEMKPARHLEAREIVQGVSLEWHRLEDCAALGAGASYELHSCEAFGDLIVMGTGFAATVENQAALRLVFRSLLLEAIVRRGSPKPKPPERKSWRDYFRR